MATVAAVAGGEGPAYSVAVENQRSVAAVVVHKASLVSATGTPVGSSPGRAFACLGLLYWETDWEKKKEFV